MREITLILFSLFCIISCTKRNDKCSVHVIHNKYLFKNNVYYSIKLDSIKNILTLEIINKTEQNILILKPEILFLKEEVRNSQIGEDDKAKFETIYFDTIKKGTTNINEYNNIQTKLIDLWQSRKIRQNNNPYFDYGYNINDYLAIIEKNKSYKEEYFINYTKTDNGTYKIIFDTGFRDDLLVNNFVNSNSSEQGPLLYKLPIDYPKDVSILIK